MRTITARLAEPAPRLALTPPSAARTAGLIFSALAPLHQLSHSDHELLHRAAAGLRLIRSTGVFSPVERNLFRIALAELPKEDAWDVEVAACFAADCAPPAEPQVRGRAGRRPAQRALWFAAVLRLAEALCAHSASAPDDIYATWTNDHLYIECDGERLRESRLARARNRTAALEAVAQRRVMLATATARRGAA